MNRFASILLSAITLGACTASTETPQSTSTSALTPAPVIGTPAHIVPPVAIPEKPIAEDLPPYTSIEGTDLTIYVNYEAKGDTAPSDTNVLNYPFITIPAATQALLNTPLSTQFDSYWTTAVGGKPSPHDAEVAAIQADVSAAVKKQMGKGYGAYNIDVTLPTSGKLSAMLSSPLLSIQYELGTVQVDFSSISPYTSGGSIDPDPRYRLKFDLALLVEANVPSTPCTFTYVSQTTGKTMTGFQALGDVTGADISALNYTASLGDFIKSVGNFFTSQPTAIFQAAEGAIDGYYAGEANPLSAALEGISSSCATADSYGFTQFSAFINGTTLGFRITHPLDAAPVGSVVGAGVPTLGTYIAAASATVTAGSSDQISGFSFPASATKTVEVTWTDTVSDLTTTNVVWGPVGSLGSTSIARSPGDGKNFLTESNLNPQVIYEFEFEDCDLLTCSPLSAPVYVETGTGVVSLVLSYGNQTLATAPISATGGFSTPITIPSSTPAGNYTLSAVSGGVTLASTNITVTALPQASLEFWNPATNTGSLGDATCSGQPCQVVIWGGSITVHGSGFAPGAVNTTVPSPYGATVYSTPADSTGQFTATFSTNGVGNANDLLTSVSQVNGQSASVLVGFENPPE